ncbi:hypothetical protein JMJ35_001060 [Cladonia borealis]|uniref:Uncharacterized protein n=1 Tax=Cladonia borealis TaxID=184061 RepID=A0AA39R7P0_9LECA|nr:hypothetical protein JMJ35_001060 [Cladonia borealis]
MPGFNETGELITHAHSVWTCLIIPTAVAQSFVDSSPRLKDNSRERYPYSSREEVYTRRRRSPQKDRSLSPRPAIVYAPSVPSGHTHSESSASPEKHRVRFDEGQHDTHYSSKVLTERRIIRRHEADRRDLNIVPVSKVRDDYARQRTHERRDTHDYDSDSDGDAYHSSDEERRKREKLRNKKLLYVGLACVTTIAAGNNIYQSTKAHHARRRYVEQGQMSEAEALRLRKKALMLDVLSVGVAAVGVNNVRMGWNRVESLS